MKRFIALMATAVLAAACLVSCESRKYKQSNPDVLTSRQIKILEENSLPTEMSQLNGRQKGGIKEIESAFVYLEEKYPGVEFEYISHTQAGLMNTEDTKFVPVGYDKEDDRNIVTVNYDRDGNYSDDYMLVLVREPMEKVVTNYIQKYFNTKDVKVFLKPGGTDLEYTDEINEKTVIGKVRSRAFVFIPDAICSESKLKSFSEDCLKWTKDDNIFCGYRATTVCREIFDEINEHNYSDVYKGEIISDVLFS